MMKRILYSLFLFTVSSWAEHVDIAPGIPYVDVVDEKGRAFRIEREQRPGSYLTNTYALTSRPSPPFFIQPFYVTPDIETYGELELLDFIRHKKGVFIDARLPNWYQKGYIPTAINIPFKLFLDDTPQREHILKRLGVQIHGDDEYDFSHAKTLLLYCNGAWCGQSPTAIRALLEIGYPADKLKYYRGGMQAWQLLGLTVVKPSKE